MIPYQLIKKKRDGEKLSYEELKEFIFGYTGGEIADYQMAALLMAIFIKGMKEDEIDVTESSKQARLKKETNDSHKK